MSEVNNTYSKNERLKSKKTIELIFAKGKTVKAHPLWAKYLSFSQNDDVCLKAGFSVPKRNFKKAVDRNLIKRRMREAYRLNNQALKLLLEKNKTGLDVMFVYNDKQITSYQDIEEKIKVILTRLIEVSEVVS